MSLRRLTPNVSYYKTRQGWEVDFIATLTNGERLLVQVCETLEKPETKTRELRALSSAMRELKLSRSFVVTRSEDEVLEEDNEKIELISAWRFLLLFSSSLEHDARAL